MIILYISFIFVKFMIVKKLLTVYNLRITNNNLFTKRGG